MADYVSSSRAGILERTNPTPARKLRWNLAQQSDGPTSVMVQFKDHGPQTADSTHVNYDQIVTYLNDVALGKHTDTPIEKQEEHLLELFDIVFTVGKRFERLGDLLTVSGARIFYDGDEINSALTDAILRLVREGKGGWEGLVAFFEKLQQNPDPRSVEQLYAWLQKGSWSITDDGDFIGYKSVTHDWMSHHATGAAMVDGVWVKGAIPNKPGSVVEMPRKSVRNDPSQSCAEGLHVGTFDFAKSFRNSGSSYRTPGDTTENRIISVKINPRNVVSVPAHDTSKLRTCKYVVVEQVTSEGTSITHVKPKDAKPSYDNDDAAFVNFKAEDFEKMGTREMRMVIKAWKVGTVRTKKADLVKIFAREAARRRRLASRNETAPRMRGQSS